MKENIRFRGLTRNRDEQGVEHGEMSICGGVELYDGALRVSVLEGTRLADGDPIVNGEDFRLIYVHHTAMYTSYITKGASGGLFYSFEYYDSDLGRKKWVDATLPRGGTGRIRSVNSVGNTLVMLYDDGLHYWLATPATYDGQPSVSYKYLGQQPPFLELQFNLKRSWFNSVISNYPLPFRPQNDNIFIEHSILDISGDRAHIKKEYKGEVTEMVHANINWATSQVVGSGCFYAPFLIRYCYRLFDGTSLIMHSPPVMLIPQLHSPVRNNIEFEGDMKVYLMMCDLQVKCLNPSVINDLKDWSDIVKSVDIFVTPQISRIDTTKLVETASFVDTSEQRDEVSLIDGQMIDIESDYHDFYYQILLMLNLDVPLIPEKDYHSMVSQASTFFKLKSVNIADVSKELDPTLSGQHIFGTLDFEPSILKNITVQEQMKDDYKTHNLLLPATTDSGGMFVYNHRLNVYGISEKLFGGFSPDVLFPYSASGTTVTEADVWINTEHGLRRVSKEGSWTVLDWLIQNGYCFYPDSRAVRLNLAAGSVSHLRSLAGANELNGAFSFLPGPGELDALPLVIIDSDIVPLSNKIYTSRADNPFYFPNLPGESGINTVGTGDIIGAAAVTRALSQGQVGDHDLVVFATDGLWAGKVSATGTYSNFHNYSREVCANPDSICQLDQSVLFATERSISRTVEQEVISITDVLDGPFFDVEQRLPGLVAYLTDQSLADVLRLVAFDTAPDVYYRRGKVFYDYMSSRIIVFREDLSSESIALVFSIRDQAWSTMDIPPLRAVVAGYPTPYVQDTSGIVTRLDTPYDHTSETLHNGIVVTRTLTYSDTMDLIRGFRQLTDASHMPLLFFYGSNDQRSWQEIGRSARAFHNYIPGHPFRFFRVAIVMQMLTAERYQQLELEIVNKYAKL